MSVITLDPVYAVIGRYRTAIAAFNNYRGPEDGDYYYELEEDFFDAQEEFWHSVPTTPEGVKTKISVFLNETTEGTTEEALKDFLDTLYKAALAIDSR
jgi:hypothetical protein